jgi:multiple sugar transport system substrate-binding protein
MLPSLRADITLDIIISQYSDNTQAWWAKDGDYIKAFEAANPGIKLNVEVVSWNDIYTVVNTRISTNQAPDILNIDTFADYVSDDLLEPTSDYVSADLQAKIIPSFWNASEMDGTVWALPILASVRAMFYNKDILAKAGVDFRPHHLGPS